MLSGIAQGAVRSPTLPSLQHDLFSLATLGTEACEGVLGESRRNGILDTATAAVCITSDLTVNYPQSVNARRLLIYRRSMS
jgi:hypothetical protein